jgi:hypothetical protein
VGANFGSDTNVILTSPDNGATITEITGLYHPVTDLFISPESVGVSPDGAYLMAADMAATQAKRSSDGGATWGNIGIPGNYQVFWCYGTNQLWVAEGAYTVKYSTDFGTTWTDITGDLQTWLPPASVWTALKIRAW